MNVGIFYNSVTNIKQFSNKALLMDNFAAGVRVHGDTAVEFTRPVMSAEPLDAGFVLGYTLENNFRRHIIDTLQRQGVPVVFVDSNVLHYARPDHLWHRYSINSVYPATGTYFFSEPNPDKWSGYSTAHGVELRPWRTTGQHILILCQRPQGWNMQGRDQMAWLDNTIDIIRQHSDRSMVIRMHPGDGRRFDAIKQIQARHGRMVAISTHPNIRQDLQDCWCAVGYNSTPTAVAAIEGVPVYVEDPVNCWAADVAFTSLSQIESPPQPDRAAWANRIANIHWSNQEVKSGQLWSAIKQHISSVR